MESDEEMKDQKIKELEKEIKILKHEVVITEESFQGNPVLRFTGPFRPFSLGINKCHAIIKHLDITSYHGKFTICTYYPST